jgi:hypothetical protein
VNRTPQTPRQALNPPRKAFSGARALGSFVPALTAKAFQKYGFSASTLVLDWSAIVGRDFAALTYPERLSWPRTSRTVDDEREAGTKRAGATLVMRVDGSRALEVQYASRQIIERINAYFGYAAVAQIRIVQAPVRAQPALPAGPARTPAPVQVDVAGVSDPRLREALSRLASQVSAHR